MVTLRSRTVTATPAPSRTRASTRRSTRKVASPKPKSPSPRTRRVSPPRTRMTRSRAKAISQTKGADWVYPPPVVNNASIVYADALNATSLTMVVQSILNKAPKGRAKTKFVAAPYIFVDRDVIHYEDKDDGYKMVRMDYGVPPPKGKKYSLEADEENMDVLLNVIAPSVHSILYSAGLGARNKTRFAGVLGIQIGVSVGQHYVAYVYDNGKFAFFDSGDPKQCDEQRHSNNTYIILVEAIRLTVNKWNDDTTCNTGVFETAAGVSEDVFNYIGQNIFCHSWSLWFLYQFIVLKKPMSQIDEMAGTGIHADRDNLWRIKRFVYDTIIPLAGLNRLYRDPAFLPFTYYIHDSDYRSGDFVSVSRRAAKNITVLPIPGILTAQT